MSRLLALAVAVVLVATGGCAGLLADRPGGQAPTATPAPVPEPTADPTPTPGADYWRNVSTDGRVIQPRYFAQRPTCERPPGLVVHIQVAALRNDDPATHQGINTTWRFAAPSNRAAVGSYAAFVDLLTEEFRPLLAARQTTYGPLERTGDSATQRVTVTDANGTRTSYIWRLRRQTEPPYRGCWMTVTVAPAQSSRG